MPICKTRDNASYPTGLLCMYACVSMWLRVCVCVQQMKSVRWVEASLSCLVVQTQE